MQSQTDCENGHVNADIQRELFDQSGQVREAAYFAVPTGSVFKIKEEPFATYSNASFIKMTLTTMLDLLYPRERPSILYDPS